MTTPLLAEEMAKRIGEHVPGSVPGVAGQAVIVQSESLLEVSRFLKETPGLDFDYLTNITGIDYLDYFEIVYHLTSIKNNHGFILKTRCYGRENPSVPSATGLWRGAELQEREVYDLMGIRFEGHPNLKRIYLWEGFEGHPLRKDYL